MAAIKSGGLGDELQLLYEFSRDAAAAGDDAALAGLALGCLQRAWPLDAVALLLDDGAAWHVHVLPGRPLASLPALGRRLIASFRQLAPGQPELPLALHGAKPLNRHLSPLSLVTGAFQVLIEGEERCAGLLAAFGDEQTTGDEHLHRFLTTVGHHLSLSLRQRRQREAGERRRLQALIEELPLGVALLDREDRVAFANARGRAYLEVLAGPLGPLVQLGDRALADLEGPLPPGTEHEVRTAEPPQRIFEVALRAVTDEPGVRLLVLQDVTRTREVQAQVLQLERLATVGQLAAGIAHHFNNILSVIIGNTQLLQDVSGLPAAASKRLDVIAQQGFWAADIVRQIMDFSRHSFSEPRTVDLGELLHTLVPVLASTMPSNIRLQADLPQGACCVLADPSQVQQIATNLVVNGRDAMPAGGTLTIRLRHVQLQADSRRPAGLRPGEWVVLAVADTGTGIAPEHVPHLFDPFFTTKELGKGTGLGLAQVYGLVQQHGGLIDVTSRPGKGATFTVYLPAARTADAPSVAPPEAPRGRGETVLLVEDEALVRDVTRGLLENLGYKVLTASNGLAAIKLFEQHQGEVAVVLADVVMPRLGGLELFHRLRQLDPGAKVLLISGYPAGSHGTGRATRGLAGWLPKPADMVQLAQALDRVLHQ